MKRFLRNWFVNVVAVMVAASMVHGISYNGLGDLLVAGLLLGFLNAFVKPILWLFSIPFLILTLGLFTLVINAILLYWVGHLMTSFRVDTFGSAFWGGVVISICSMFLNSVLGPDQPNRRPPPRQPPPSDGGNGPVIDV